MYDCTTNKKLDIEACVLGFCSCYDFNHGYLKLVWFEQINMSGL